MPTDSRSPTARASSECRTGANSICRNQRNAITRNTPKLRGTARTRLRPLPHAPPRPHPTPPPRRSPRQPVRPQHRSPPRGWLGEIEGLQISLTAAEAKLTDLDQLTSRQTTVHLGMPTLDRLAGRTIRRVTGPHQPSKKGVKT
jgi:hypothetical protein